MSRTDRVLAACTFSLHCAKCFASVFRVNPVRGCLLRPGAEGGVTCPGSHSKGKAAGASHGSRVSFGFSIPRSQRLSCFGSLVLDWSQREIRSGAFMAGFKLPGRADRLGK